MTASWETSASVEELTPAELRVLVLMARADTNSRIAEVLVLSRRTVENHVRQIFLKLDLTAATDADKRVLAVLKFLGAREAA